MGPGILVFFAFAIVAFLLLIGFPVAVCRGVRHERIAKQ
jgi:hypothetical protein